jgi:hypothetical protein
MNRGSDLVDKADIALSNLEAYVYELETEIRILRQENIELNHECQDLSAANIMARASKDYSDSV